MVKVLVTGGCGFIGTNLVSYLLDHTNWEISVIDDLSEGKKEYLTSIFNYDPERISFVEGDIRDEDDVEQAITGCDHVVHLAAQTDVIASINAPFKDADINVTGTLNMLEASLRHGIKRFAFASSAAAVGEHAPPVDESKIPKPISPYGASKLTGEAYCSAYAGSHGMTSTALRFANVYGPNSWHKGSVVAEFIKTIIDGKRPVIFGDGDQTRDFVHAADISSAIKLSLTAELPSPFEVFQLGTGTETSVNQLFSIVEDALTDKGIEVPSPRYAPARAGEIYRNYCDISKAKDILGYTPDHDIEKGIQSSVDWFTD